MQAMLLAGSMAMIAPFAKTANKELLNHWRQRMFKKQRYGHGLCSITVSHLRDLLRDEFNRGHRFDSPWDCFEHDCPGFKQPMHKSCGCYRDATKAHIAEVLKEINKS